MACVDNTPHWLGTHNPSFHQTKNCEVSISILRLVYLLICAFSLVIAVFISSASLTSPLLQHSCFEPFRYEGERSPGNVAFLYLCRWLSGETMAEWTTNALWVWLRSCWKNSTCPAWWSDGTNCSHRPHWWIPHSLPSPAGLPSHLWRVQLGLPVFDHSELIPESFQ